eukprot:Rmarinus@m.29303
MDVACVSVAMSWNAVKAQEAAGRASLVQGGQMMAVVELSPWAVMTSMAVGGLVGGLAGWMNGLNVSLTLGLLGVVMVMGLWMRDTYREGHLLGWYTTAEYGALKAALVLFIGSEVLFFAGFFWALFAAWWSPSLVLGGMWPACATGHPYEMAALGLPLVNTLLLLTSGCMATWAHHGLLGMVRGQTLVGMTAAVLCGTVFLCLQAMEYQELGFSLSDGVFGSSFFMLTGFHGFHVLVGTVMLLVATVLLARYVWTPSRSYGFDFALWYWHFVDVVWLFLFVALYLGSFGV